MEKPTDLPVATFSSPEAWEAWLAAEGQNHRGLWLRLAKKGAPEVTVTYDQALEGALCWGWIDGQKRSLDAHFFLQRFTPRRKGSIWSQRNVEKVKVLRAEGRMGPPGEAEAQAAEGDGRWDQAYAGSAAMEIPREFYEALEGRPRAAETFRGLKKAQLFAIGFRLTTAKTAETRQRRLALILDQLEAGPAQDLFRASRKPTV